MKVFQLQFADSFVKPILDNGASKVVQFSFPKGKVLEKHSTSSDILIFVLKGRIRLTANEEATLQAGDLASLEKNVEHSLEALEESLVIWYLRPVRRPIPFLNQQPDNKRIFEYTFKPSFHQTVRLLTNPWFFSKEKHQGF